MDSYPNPVMVPRRLSTATPQVFRSRHREWCNITGTTLVLPRYGTAPSQWSRSSGPLFAHISKRGKPLCGDPTIEGKIHKSGCV
jgi:hypothetical protein